MKLNRIGKKIIKSGTHGLVTAALFFNMSACSPSADELKNKIVDKVAAFLPHKAGTDELGTYCATLDSTTTIKQQLQKNISMGDNIENNQKRLEKATKEFLERYEQDEQRIKDIQALVIKYWDKGGDKATLKKAIEERIKANTKHTTSQKTDYKALLQLLDAQREALGLQ